MLNIRIIILAGTALLLAILRYVAPKKTNENIAVGHLEAISFILFAITALFILVAILFKSS